MRRRARHHVGPRGHRDRARGAIGGILSNPAHRGETLHIDTATVGYWPPPIHRRGRRRAVLRRKADKLGRRRLFIVTLRAVYMIASGLTAISIHVVDVYLAMRFFAGMGIGGEYAAIHSAIDELSPRSIAAASTSRSRHYWGGAMLAAVAQFVLLDSTLVPVNWRWNNGAAIGPAIGFAQSGRCASYIPESPRWQLTHGHAAEAEATVDASARTARTGIELADGEPAHAIVVEATPPASIRFVARSPRSAVSAAVRARLTLMITQSVPLQRVFFTTSSSSRRDTASPSATTALLLLPVRCRQPTRALLLGRFFDTVGRRKHDRAHLLLVGVCCSR